MLLADSDAATMPTEVDACLRQLFSVRIEAMVLFVHQAELVQICDCRLMKACLLTLAK